MRNQLKTEQERQCDNARFNESAEIFGNLTLRFSNAHTEEDESEAFVSIYSHLQRPVYRFLRSRFQMDVAYAMDAFHDALRTIAEPSENPDFYCLVTKHGTLEGGRQQLRWFFRVTCNKAIDVLRKESRQRLLLERAFASRTPSGELEDQSERLFSAMTQVASKLKKNQRLVCEVMLEQFPRNTTGTEVHRILTGRGHRLSPKGVKRALEVVRGKLRHLLVSRGLN